MEGSRFGGGLVGRHCRLVFVTELDCNKGQFYPRHAQCLAYRIKVTDGTENATSL